MAGNAMRETDVRALCGLVWRPQSMPSGPQPHWAWHTCYMIPQSGLEQQKVFYSDADATCQGAHMRHASGTEIVPEAWHPASMKRPCEAISSITAEGDRATIFRVARAVAGESVEG